MKWNNKKTGEFKSRLEAQMYRKAKAVFKGKRVGYEVSILSYTVPREYRPDLTVMRSDGKPMFIEIKGYFRPEDRSKMRYVKLCNPDADIRMVFAQDNKLRKNSKSRYSDWCTKNGFPYAIGQIPQGWKNV